jgi:transposase-like protein
MPQKKHKPEEIVAKLRQVDLLVSQGQSVAEAVRTIGVTQFGLARLWWRAPTEEPGGALWETETGRRRSFGVKRCGWR